MGPWDLGVRTSSGRLHGLLRSALRHHFIADEDTSAPANFSLRLGSEDGTRGAADFHVLYRGTAPVVRTRRVGRLVEGLLAHLSSFVEAGDPTSLELDVVALVTDGVALLAPSDLRHVLPSIERRLNAKGLRVVDRPWARIDPTTCELVVAAPQLVVDREPLHGLAGAGRERQQDEPVPPGRYPVRGWAFGAGTRPQGPISRALAVTLAGSALLNLASLGEQDALDGLVRVMSGLQPVAVWSDRPEKLVAPLSALAPTA